MSLTPLVNENWERNSVYGFGFIARDELQQLGRAVHDATAPAEEVIAPSVISFEANRRQLIRYPENIGVVRLALEEYRSRGFAATRARRGRADFFQLITESSHVWNEEVVRAVAPGGSVNTVIVDAPVQLLPLVNASDQALLQRGFRSVLRTRHFTVWHRVTHLDPSPAGGRPIVW